MRLTVHVPFSVQFLQSLAQVTAGHCLRAGGDAMTASLGCGGARLVVVMRKASLLREILHIDGSHSEGCVSISQSIGGFELCLFVWHIFQALEQAAMKHRNICNPDASSSIDSDWKPRKVVLPTHHPQVSGRTALLHACTRAVF